jgi:hypothetical protein
MFFKLVIEMMKNMEYNKIKRQETLQNQNPLFRLKMKIHQLSVEKIYQICRKSNKLRERRSLRKYKN